MHRFLLLICVLSLCWSCGASAGDVQTAIARTQAAIPTQTATQTATPTSTPRPTETATPTPTATPNLFSGTAQSITPGVNDLPGGFSLNPNGSGPSSIDNGDGYSASFRNDNNILAMNGDVVVGILSVFVMKSIQAAVPLYQRFQNGAAVQMNSTAPGPVTSAFVSVPVTVPRVSDASATCGTIKGPMFPSTTCSVAILYKNVVVQVFVAGNDLGNSQAAILSQAVYFISLVTQKLQT